MMPVAEETIFPRTKLEAFGIASSTVPTPAMLVCLQVNLVERYQAEISVLEWQVFCCYRFLSFAIFG
jgi:hypothetical protein